MRLPPLPNDAGTDAPLLVGFSGGLDSTVLLHRLAADPQRRAAGLRAIHVHHGLLAQAQQWEAHCQRFCLALGIALETVKVRVERNHGQGLEAAARQARYRAFLDAMRAGEVLVTAHHRKDQAETFLLRALRASGPDGLAAIRPWRRLGQGWQWRPLLETPREDLERYAQAHALHWIDDPSNEHLQHDRNFLRHRVLPLLRERWPHAEAALARSAGLTAEAVALLAHDDALALAQVRTLDPRILSVARLCGLPTARRARVLRRWLEENGLPALPAEGVRHIETDLLRAASDSEAEFAWQDAIVRRWRDLLHADRQRPPLPADWEAVWEGTSPLQLPTGDRLELETAGQSLLPLRVTARRGGERLRLPGQAHSQALKKLLQAAGVPPWERLALPLIHAGDGELLAAGDLLYSARFDAWLRENGARLRWRRVS